MVISVCDQVCDARVCPLHISLLASQISKSAGAGEEQEKKGRTVNPNIESHPHDYRYNHSSDPIHQLRKTDSKGSTRRDRRRSRKH